MTIYLVDKYKVASQIDYFVDRPGFAWLDAITRSIFGLKPLYWQLVFLTIRWLTAWGMWRVLTHIWPEHKERAAWSAIFFTVYPSFLSQSVAVNYKAQFFSYLCYFLSLIFMILAYKKRGYFWQYTILGVFATAGHLFTTEYMVGLEVIRPVILFLIISPDILEWKERIKAIVKNWLPYLLMILVFIGYRFVFFPGDVEPNPLIIFNDTNNIVTGILDLILISLKDVYHVLVISWSNIVQLDVVSINSPGDLLAWAIAIAVSALVYFTIRSVLTSHSDESNQKWEGRAIFFGLFSVFVGLIPVWMAGKQVISGGWADRFSIPAMFGASIFLVALLSLLISNRNYRRIVFTVLLGISISAQIRASNDFRWDWVRQTRYYWQMVWRAPAIEPYTPVIAEGALTGTTNRYNAAFALNMLYPQDERVDLPALWYFELTYNHIYRHIPEIYSGMTLEDRVRTEEFNASSQDSLILYTPSNEDQCLWFLTPRDVNNNEIIPEMRELSLSANLDRILREPVSADYPSKEIFGPEPKHGWCYYFQKASLARQFEDWDEIIRLWDEAGRAGFQTAYAYELIPFIEAFAYTGDWDQAAKISMDAYEMGYHKNLMLCASWQDMGEIYRGNEAFDLAYGGVAQVLNCE